jgi:uncharacterized protein
MLIMRKVIFGGFFLAALVGGMSSLPARASTLAEAEAAYAARDYRLAVSLFTPLAEGGNLPAQVYLGYLFEKGLGVATSPARALSW